MMSLRAQLLGESVSARQRSQQCVQNLWAANGKTKALITREFQQVCVSVQLITTVLPESLYNFSKWSNISD